MCQIKVNDNAKLIFGYKINSSIKKKIYFWPGKLLMPKQYYPRIYNQVYNFCNIKLLQPS